MSIQYAILGLLSWQPLSGYDIKKLFADSAAFPWSGNNNQIYTTLVQLHKQDLVSQEVRYQDTLPARKVYTITAAGREALRKWVLAAPQLPELRSTFLIQLAWADQLDPHQLDALLTTYEEEVQMQLVMHKENARRGALAPNRTPREAFLWDQISQNIRLTYQTELAWVRQVRQELQEKFS